MTPPTAQQPNPAGSRAQRLGRLYCSWNASRSALYQGWWMLTSFAMVADAHLDTSQLLIIAAVQGVASMLTEIPAGVIADGYSRKASLVIFHALRAAAMIVAGLFPTFGPLLVANALNGVSWTFSSGADVAWITDELDDEDRSTRVLVKSMQASMLGSAAGMVGLGLIATVWGRLPTMVLAGVGMGLLGVFVAARFPERRIARTEHHPYRQAQVILRAGARATWKDPILLALLAITVLANGAFDSLGRIYAVRLEQLGLPTASAGTIWWTALGVAGLLLGTTSMHLVRHHIHQDRTTAIALATALLLGTVSCLLLGYGQHLSLGIIGTLMFTGISAVVVGNTTTLWVNRRVDSTVRATIHSFFGQAEYLGEIACSAALAAVAAHTPATTSFLAAAALLALAAVLVTRKTRPRPTAQSPTRQRSTRPTP